MTQSRIELPGARKRSYVFALTPLADAMFQLLIFFMLTSSLTPYSLLTLASGPGTASGDTQEQVQEEPSGADSDPAATWTVEDGQVLANGQAFGFDSLPQLAEILVAADTPRVMLISSPRARVQDLVTVLEILAAAQITSVQIVSMGGP
ncbi:hypothetical protein ASD8599_03977 [Ascidiaceihabitans donghaensis]|uniref:Biopolymer transport protein ExbD n=1 Tax=Ascidiaceihabitans donghaensis TaxID=1510460 RepID=A0A2R8BPS7_9RHOB|nr:biopolymer transporter ExbD [Ascidiaceihabitans donghaensis]SPH27511.1 hypothetical protein ASD8599_03977 [Ascidiaceihabitans donghaensis]